MEERIINIGGSGGGRPNPRKRRKNRVSQLTIILLAVCAVAVCVVVIVCIFAFTSGNKKNKLVGTWEYNDSIHYTFEEDGKGHIADSGYEYDYSYKNDKSEIQLDFKDDFIVDCRYKYSIDGDELTLIGSEGTDGGTYTLKRAEH